MTRDETNNAAMFEADRNRGALNLQPFNLAIGQLLEEKGNRFAKGASFKPKMSEVNELMFVMTHDVETLLAIPDKDWRKEVLRFSAGLTQDQIAEIQAHTKRQIDLVASTATTPGKGVAAGQA